MESCYGTSKTVENSYIREKTYNNNIKVINESVLLRSGAGALNKLAATGSPRGRLVKPRMDNKRN